MISSSRQQGLQTISESNLDAGGFIEEPSTASQNAEPGHKNRVSNIRSLTIKQLLEAASNNGDVFSVDGVDVGQVVIVGCIRSARETATGIDYVIEDGTGGIAGKCWQDRGGAPVG